jgi:YggT family protein
MLMTMYAYLIAAIFFLIYLVIYSRFAFQLVRAPFINQVAQWVYRSTNPVVQPMERVIPRWRHISIASLVLLLIAAMLKVALLTGASAFSTFGVRVALSDALSFALRYWIWAIFISIVLGWLFSVVERRRDNDLVDIVFMLARPLCALPRRFFRTHIGVFDFAPVIVLFVLAMLDIAQRQLLLGTLN